MGPAGRAGRRAWGVLALAWILVGLAAPAVAATFRVDTTVDAPDAVPGDGHCAATGINGRCTLRAAIQEANALPGLDEIIVPEGIYALTVSGPGRGASDAWGSLKIFDSVHITGAGAKATIVSARDLKAFGYRERVMLINPRDQTGPGPFVRIVGLTLRDGNVTGRGGGYGGGLSVVGASVELRACVIADNQADFGGGIFAERSALELVDVTIARNKAGWGGGIMGGGAGLPARGGAGSVRGTNLVVVGNEADEGGGIRFDSGVVQLRGGDISGNLAHFRGGGLLLLNGTTTGGAWLENVRVTKNLAREGGGIYSDLLGLVVIFSEVSSNTASGDGGGIYLPRRPTTASPGVLIARTQITQSTISENLAEGDGGGLFNGMSLDIDTSTFSMNEANRGGGFLNVGGHVELLWSTLYQNRALLGGGFVNVELPVHGSADPIGGEVLFANSIIAGNAGGACARIRVRTDGDFSPVLSEWHNLLDDGTTCPAAVLDVLAKDPMLGPLQFNGGPTRTHQPLPESPAIDAITVDAVEPTGLVVRCVDSEDQRRVPRPQGRACDIGAVELEQFGDSTPPP